MRYPREDTKPWYKQFWPWFIITPPLMGIVLGVLLVSFATHDPDGFVVADYTREGRGINQRIERAEFASRLGLMADVSIEGPKVWIDLHSHVTIPKQQSLALTFMHPTREHMDVKLQVVYDPVRSLYYAEIDALQAALWYVNLEPEDGSWRLRGRFDDFADQEIQLKPSA